MMTGNTAYSYLLIAIMAIVTALLRFSPFKLFNNGENKLISYYGKILPAAAIAMLVVFCLQDVDVTNISNLMINVIAVAVVVVVQYRKSNTILSVVTGTITYMILLNIL